MDACQTVELSASDVRIVAGERGTLELQGISAEARAMCSTILASLRCGAKLRGVRCFIEFVDVESVVVGGDCASTQK